MILANSLWRKVLATVVVVVGFVAVLAYSVWRSRRPGTLPSDDHSPR